MIRIMALCASLALGGFATGVPAQTYPVKPIRFIVPFPPGGGSDFLVRLLAQDLSGALGQQVVLDNRGGAQGSLGTALAAKAPPDGYTLVLTILGILAMNPWIYQDVGYDPVKDFTHITLATTQPLLVVVNPRVPAKTLRELAAIAKARPDQLTFATSSSTTHLAGELFKQLSGTKMVQVPYKGGGPAIIDLLGGHVDLSFASIPSVQAMVSAGKLRAVAVTSSARIAALPDVPTSKESGFPQFEVNSWYSVAGPANMPKDIVARLNTEIARALRTPGIRDKLQAEGLEPRSSTPEEMAAYVKAEYERWGKVVRSAGIKPG
ncbi:MAG: Bug family tripartite tricarboxylate transporter substrate binding protein [Burkholderiales bacterium]